MKTKEELIKPCIINVIALDQEGEKQKTIEMVALENVLEVMDKYKDQFTSSKEVSEVKWQSVFSRMWDEGKFDDKYSKTLEAIYFFQMGFKAVSSLNQLSDNK